MNKSFDELLNKLPSARRARIKAKTQDLLAEIALGDLRRALKLTQKQIAKILDIDQAAVSKFEGQSDMYVSTLSRFITALGGSLSLVAKFPDREVELANLSGKRALKGNRK